MKSLTSKLPWSESANKSRTWSEHEGLRLEARGLSEGAMAEACIALQAVEALDEALLVDDSQASSLTPQASAMIGTKPGKLVVISGPSGVGKSTVVRKVLERLGPVIRLSVSATTRPPRPGERDGIDYYFLTDAEFERRREA